MRLVLIAVFLTSCAAPALGQAGSIGIFADPQGTDCNLVDVIPGLVSFYVVHVYSSGTTASHFYAPQPACLNGIYLSTMCIYPIGPCDAQTDVAQGYGFCMTGSMHVATIAYFLNGLTTPCCHYPVLPSPYSATGEILVVDCADNLLAASGGEGIINPTPECMCDVSTAPSTWGRVKALYKN